MGLDETKETHESWGQAVFVRRSGGSGEHYGSSVNCFHYIAMIIKRSERCRSDLSETRYYGRERLIEIEFTPNQFADLITCLGMGDGIPCTIRSIAGKEIKYKPTISQRREFVEEYERDMKAFTQSMRTIVEEVREIFDQPTIKKSDRAIIIGKIEKLVTQLRSHLPFVHEQFNEAMEKTVTEAKAEVESFFNTAVHSLGLEALHEQVRQLAKPPQIEDHLKLEDHSGESEDGGDQGSKETVKQDS